MAHAQCTGCCELKHHKDCNFLQKTQGEEEHVDDMVEDPVSFEDELKRFSGKEREKALK